MKRVVIMPIAAFGIVFVLLGCSDSDDAKDVAQKATDVAMQKAVETVNGVVDTAMDATSEKVGEMTDDMADKAKEVAGEKTGEMVDTAKDAAADAMKGAVDDMMGTGEKTYTLAEVAKHNRQADCWTVVDGTVADVTSFFGIHPGGDDKLIQACGKDATELFMSIKKHDPKGYKKFESFAIGTLVQ